MARRTVKVSNHSTRQRLRWAQSVGLVEAWRHYDGEEFWTVTPSGSCADTIELDDVECYLWTSGLMAGHAAGVARCAAADDGLPRALSLLDEMLQQHDDDPEAEPTMLSEARDLIAKAAGK